MTQTMVYFNGRFLPRCEAKLDIEDRGAMFGDGVYEVLRYYGGRPLTMAEHLARLRQSMTQISLPAPADVDALPRISDELVKRNGLTDARVYWQVTRGPAPREHAMPRDSHLTLLVMAHPASPLPSSADAPAALTAILHEDLRWHRCCIKSLMLLPNALAKTRARDAGAGEAILHRGQVVTEGSSTNLFIVRGGELLTHPASHEILNGITRQLVIQLAGQLGITATERQFNIDDLLTADEALLTGTTTHVAAAVKVDEKPIGNGKIGPVTRQLHEAFVRHVETCCVS